MTRVADAMANAHDEHTCAHCGLLVGPRASSVGDGERYCCTGCFVAHRLSHRGVEGRVDRLLARVVLSAFLAMGVMVFSLSLYAEDVHGASSAEAARALAGIYRLCAFAFATPVLLLLGVPLADAVFALRRWFSAEALILAGAAAAWCVSVWNTFVGDGHVYYDTATMVLVLYSLGRWLDARTRERATQELLRIAPERETAVALLGATSDSESSVAAASVRVGDLVRVRAGEVVPVDGFVVRGRSFADTSALTGEAQPKSLGAGDFVLAGAVLVDGSLDVRVERAAGARLRDEIERLLRETLHRRPRVVELADRLAGSLMPFVLVLAVATAALRWRSVGAERALLDALSVVLISCPCALGVATPLAFWSAIGLAWKRGVLVRGGDVLERLASARRVLFDKTGTLTSGELELVALEPERDMTRARALELAVALEQGAEHPIARSLRRHWRGHGSPALPEVRDFRVLPGIGVEGCIDGARLQLRRDAVPSAIGETSVVLASGDDVYARLRMRDHVREEAREVVDALARAKYELGVLTGDDHGAAKSLELELELTVDARLTPIDKVAHIRAAGRGTIFVGDGLNDAAALAAADVGISVAGSAHTSLGAAEVNLLRPGLSELPRTLALARAAVATARFNLAWAFAYNGIGLWLAASGRLTPIFAASAMVASSLVSVMSSARLRGLARGDTAEHSESAVLRTPAYGAGA